MTRTHHISRLQYKVSCSDEAQAFELRHTISSIVTQEVTAAIDEICNRYIKKDEWIRIPKLEINLGNLTMHALRGYGTTLFSLQFEQQLRKELDNLQHTPTETLRQADETEILLFFLETGALPRWAFAPDIDLVYLTDTVFPDNGDRLTAFLTAQSTNANIWLRIKQQLDDSAKETIVDLLPDLQTAYQTIQSVITRKLSAPVPDSAVRDEVLLQAPHLFAGTNTELIIDQIIQSIGRERNPTQPHEITPSIHSPTVKSPLQKVDDETIPSPKAETYSLYSEDQKETKLADEKLVIHTSGIVLLQSFLKPFFTRLGLLDAGEWVNEDAQQRSIHLLHYLSTGKQQQPEWNLVLEKIICGLQPEHPILKNVVLGETEIIECHELLTSVIEHWTALKNTSVSALQEVFLRRDGLLAQTNEGWLLQVERKTHDILLEALPWGFSILKFPWTNYLIEVVWL